MDYYQSIYQFYILKKTYKIIVLNANVQNDGLTETYEIKILIRRISKVPTCVFHNIFTK